MTKHSRPHPRAPCPALRSAMPVRCTPPPSRCCEAAGAERNSRLGAQRPIQTRPGAEAGAESAHCPPVPSLPAPRLTGGRGAGPDAWPQPHPSLWVHACCCSHCKLSGPGRGAPTALQPRGRSSRGLRACLWGTYSTVSASMSRCLSAGPAPLARTAGEQPQWTGPPGLRGPVPVPRRAHLPRTPTTLGSSRVSPGAVPEGVWDLHLELDWHFPADMEDKPFYCLFGTQGVSACVLEVSWPGFLFYQVVFLWL